MKVFEIKINKKVNSRFPFFHKNLLIMEILKIHNFMGKANIIFQMGMFLKDFLKIICKFLAHLAILKINNWLGFTKVSLFKTKKTERGNFGLKISKKMFMKVTL